MANINIILEAGLTNDYGVFNLNSVMLSCLNVDIISNGDQFVESENSEFQHGGNTNYKDHEGIKPIDSNTYSLEKYGSTLINKLKNYINDISYTQGSKELWEDYKGYSNQFKIKFDKEPNINASKEYEYISYNNSIINVNDNKKEIVTYQLSEESNIIGIETYIIHFSKYYNIYSLISGSQKVLRPLLYYSEDLDTYNIGINGNAPYLKYLACLDFWRTDDHSHRREYLHINLADYNEKEYIYNCNNENITSIVDDFERSKGGHHWSQFRTNPENRPTFETTYEEQLKKMPTGFFLLGFYYKNRGYWFDKTNTGSEEVKSLPEVWKNTFISSDDKFNVTTRRYSGMDSDIFGIIPETDNSGLIGGKTYGKYAFIGLMYRYDKNKNWHIFNSYFPIELPSKRQENLNLITQNIHYKTGTSIKYPKTLGLLISSILTSMYVYKDESAQNIKYISDIVFLGNHSTTYTKDIVYKIYKNDKKINNKEVIDNDLLLFHKVQYSTYITSLQEYTKDDNDKTFSNNNVNAVIKSGVKNIPLQFKLNYLQPELNTIGDISSVQVCKITGEKMNYSTDIVKPNQLYYLDDNNNINTINSNFTIKWLENLEEKDGVLLGKLDTKLKDTPNSNIWNMFNYDDGNLGFENNEIIGKSTSRYAIKTDHDIDNIFFDLLTNDVLLPAARIF